MPHPKRTGPRKKPGPKPDVLTLKQRKFVDAYCGEANGNQTAAMRIAGYSGTDKQLSSLSSEMMRTPKIRDALRALTEGDPLVASREERLQWLSRVMRGHELEADVPARLKACEMLCKMSGDFIEKREVDVRALQAVVILPDNQRVKVEGGGD